MCQNVLWQSGLQEDVLDFDAGNEAVIVRVCLLEQGVEHEHHVVGGLIRAWKTKIDVRNKPGDNIINTETQK